MPRNAPRFFTRTSTSTLISAILLLLTCTPVLAEGLGNTPQPADVMPAPMPSQEPLPPAPPAPTMHPDWQGVSHQDEQLAQRAAIANAHRNMAELVKGLRVDAETCVRDFVAENAAINADLDAFIRNCRIAETRYIAGPTCEVDVECTIQELQQVLRKILDERWHSPQWQPHTFDGINDYCQDKTLIATGSGAPGSRAADPAHAPEAGMSTLPESEWAGQSVRATGSGVPPEGLKDCGQARALAERAAEADAKRNLLEKISAMHVDSTTCVGDYASQHDDVSSRLNAILAATKKVDTRYLEDGRVEVDVEVPLTGVWDIVKGYR